MNMIELKTLTQTSSSVNTSLEYILKSLFKWDTLWVHFKVTWRHWQIFEFNLFSSKWNYFSCLKWKDWTISTSKACTTKIELESIVKFQLKWVGFQSWSELDQYRSIGDSLVSSGWLD